MFHLISLSPLSLPNLRGRLFCALLATLCCLSAAHGQSSPSLSVSLTPTAPLTNQTLTATPLVSGVSGEGLVYRYNFKVEGVIVQSGPARTLDLSQTGYGDVGQSVSVQVEASHANGEPTVLAPGLASVSVANSEPVITRQTFTVALNQATSLSLEVRDDDGDALSTVLAGGNLPPGLALSGGLIVGTPTQTGQFAFGLTIGDGRAAPKTANFIIIVSGAADGLAPVVTRSPLASHYTRDGLASLVYLGSVTDVAPPGVTPTGVLKVLFQLRRNSDGFAWSGNPAVGFSADTNSGYYPSFLFEPVPNTTAGTRTFRRTFSSFIPPASVLVPGEYSLVIAGQDNAGNYSVAVSDFHIVAAPVAPLNLSATAGAEQVTLAWNATPGATSYRVFRRLASGTYDFTDPVAIVSGTSANDSGLTAGTTYHYVVRSVNAIGTSPDSNEASATPTLASPWAPAGLTATAGAADTSIQLAWNAVGSASSYQVFRSTASGSYDLAAPLVTTTATTFADSSAAAGPTYYYVVRALNAAGASPLSNQASAALTPAPTPTATPTPAPTATPTPEPTATPTPEPTATPTPEPTPMPAPLTLDAQIRADAASAWLGEGIVNGDGAGQTLTNTIAGGQTQSRSIRIARQGGGASQTVKVTLPDWTAFAAAGWTASFTDASNGLDISAQITNAAGWSIVMNDGETREILATVTAPQNATASATGALTFRVAAETSSETSALDAVKALWSVSAPASPPSLDLAIRAHNGVWLGQNVINQDGTDQTLETVADSSHVASGQLKLSVAGAQNGQTVTWSVPDWATFQADGWDARFFDAPTEGNEITAQITGAGWTTTHANGAEPVIRWEVIAPAGSSDVTRVLSVRASLAGGVADVVRASVKVLRNARPDVSIRHVEGEPPIGENVFSPTAQQLELVTTVQKTENFIVKITNSSSTTAQFLFERPTPTSLPSGWRYKFYGTDGEVDSLLESQNLITPMLAPYQSVEWRLELALEANSDTTGALPVRFSGADAFDECQLALRLQGIKGAEYSLNGGASWTAVEGVGAVISVPKGSTLGLRALPLVPAVPWPNDPFQPAWWREGKPYFGDLVFLYYPDPTPAGEAGEIARVECGNSFDVRVKVKSEETP